MGGISRPSGRVGRRPVAGGHCDGPARGGAPARRGAVVGRGQLTVSAVSSTTNDVWSVTSSVLVKRTVTAWPL